MIHSVGASVTIISLLLLIMTIYAVGGVETFREAPDMGDEFFGTYTRAMMTLLQVTGIRIFSMSQICSLTFFWPYPDWFWPWR